MITTTYFERPMPTFDDIQCGDCKHSIMSRRMDGVVCSAPGVGSRRGWRTVWLRGEGDACGPDAKLFEVKT